MFLKDILKLTFASLILLVSCVNPSYSGSTTNPVYSGSGGSVGPPGPALSTDDEGVQVEATTTTMNFTGAGVTATGAGNTVTVAIPGGGTGSGATTETSGVVHPTPVVAGVYAEEFAVGGVTNSPGVNQADVFIDGNGNIYLNTPGAGINTTPGASGGELLQLEERGSANGNTFTITLGGTDLTSDVLCTVQPNGSLDASCPLINNISPGGALTLDSLTDVNTASNPPTTGSVLTWDPIQSEWVPLSDLQVIPPYTAATASTTFSGEYLGVFTQGYKAANLWSDVECWATAAEVAAGDWPAVGEVCPDSKASRPLSLSRAAVESLDEGQLHLQRASTAGGSRIQTAGPGGYAAIVETGTVGTPAVCPGLLASQDEDCYIALVNNEAYAIDFEVTLTLENYAASWNGANLEQVARSLAGDLFSSNTNNPNTGPFMGAWTLNDPLGTGLAHTYCAFDMWYVNSGGTWVNFISATSPNQQSSTTQAAHTTPSSSTATVTVPAGNTYKLLTFPSAGGPTGGHASYRANWRQNCLWPVYAIETIDSVASGASPGPASSPDPLMPATPSTVGAPGTFTHGVARITISQVSTVPAQTSTPGTTPGSLFLEEWQTGLIQDAAGLID